MLKEEKEKLLVLKEKKKEENIVCIGKIVNLASSGAIK